MDEATAAVLTTLQQWIQVLLEARASCRLKNPSRTESGVVFRFGFDFFKLTKGGEGAVTKLREAIDLVYRVLALHTNLATEIKNSSNGQDVVIDDCHDVSIHRALEQDAPFQVEILTIVRQVKDAAILKKILVDELLVRLTETTSNEPTCLAARTALNAFFMMMRCIKLPAEPELSPFAPDMRA